MAILFYTHILFSFSKYKSMLFKIWVTLLRKYVIYRLLNIFCNSFQVIAKGWWMCHNNHVINALVMIINDTVSFVKIDAMQYRRLFIYT